MKRVITILFLFPLFLFSCQNTQIEELFDKTPEQRVAAQIIQMQDELIGSEYGWSVYYQYNNMKNKRHLNIVFKNNEEAIITYLRSNGEVKKEKTTYTLRYTQQIDLIFDTHSFFATLVGKQSGGDFRFEFDKRDAGKIYFNNRNDKTEGEGILELTKANTPDEFIRE